MPALLLLLAALGLNFARHRRGLSTICSTGRASVGPLGMAAIWTVISIWFLPHCFRRDPFGRLILRLVAYLQRFDDDCSALQPEEN